MNRRTALIAAAVAGLVLILVVAIAQTGGEDSVDEVLAQTFGEQKSIKSGRLEASVQIEANGLAQLQGPVALRLSGPFASTEPSELPRFDFELGIDASGQRLNAGAVSTGDKGFLRFQGQAYAVGDQLFEQFRKGYAEQAECNGEREAGVSFSAIGVDPRRWLTDPKREGTEEVGGTETIHISAGVDVTRFVEDLNRILGRTDLQQDPCAEEGEESEENTPEPSSRQLTDEQRAQIVEAVQDARVDIWTGEDDTTLRRINVDLRLDVPAEREEAANGLKDGRVRFDLLLGALNEEQEIAAPEGARPLEELVAGLSGQQVPGLGGSEPDAQGGGETPPAGESSEYLECAAQAGNDVEKLQECADLVGG